MLALIRFFSSMQSFMLDKGSCMSETLVAMAALKRLYARVYSYVLTEDFRSGKTFITMRAIKLPFTSGLSCRTGRLFIVFTVVKRHLDILSVTQSQNKFQTSLARLLKERNRGMIPSHWGTLFSLSCITSWRAQGNNLTTFIIRNKLRCFTRISMPKKSCNCTRVKLR